MKTTTILSLAILATLPFAANATDLIGPAPVPPYGTPVVATVNPPYQTVTVGANDNSHIASTAYVKGAYNDAIAAVNKVAGKLGSDMSVLNAEISAVSSSLSLKRIDIYTTWDTTDIIQIPLSDRIVQVELD